MIAWRHLFLATALCGFLSAPAYAAGNTPKGPWSVGPINAKSSTGLAYCSMKNEYGEGRSLVFARDAEGSNSLAIDLGSKKLTAGAQYAVTIDVGMLTRQMVAVAATQDVMIVQLGTDNAFFDMLRRKDLMQVSFKDNSLTFGLDGSAEAVGKLAECAEGKMRDSVNVELKPQPSETIPDEKEVLKKEMSIGTQALNSSLQDEIDRLRIENRRLLQENQEIARELVVPETEDPEIAAAKKEQKKLQEENKKLQESLKKKKQSAPKEKPVEKPPAPKPVKKTGDGIMLRVLKAAQIPAMLSGLSDTSKVYTWNDGAISGGAVQDPLPEGQTISTAVTDYIARAENGCQGDFAYKLGAVTRIDIDTEMMTGEMACLDGNKDTAGALLYITDADTISVIMLDAPTDQIASALDKRDAIASKVSDAAKDKK